MSFDFPASPTENQTFDAPNGPKYIYKSPVWKIASNANVGTAFIHCADTPPTSPSHGQQWFETDSGNTFVWMDDGTSQQWVQMNGTGLPDAPVDGLSYSRKSGLWMSTTPQLLETKLCPLGGTSSVDFYNLDVNKFLSYDFDFHNIWPGLNGANQSLCMQIGHAGGFIVTTNYANARFGALFGQNTAALGATGEASNKFIINTAFGSSYGLNGNLRLYLSGYNTGNLVRATALTNYSDTTPKHLFLHSGCAIATTGAPIDRASFFIWDNAGNANVPWVSSNLNARISVSGVPAF